MSKKQWGHGYYTGLNERKNRSWLATYDEDNVLACIYQVHEKYDSGKYLIEAIDYYELMTTIAVGHRLAFDPVNPMMCEEVSLDELGNYKVFCSWESVVKEFVGFHEVMKARKE